MDVREKLIDLIIDAKRTDPETGSFNEYLADHLISNGVKVQEWISVKEKLPEDPLQTVLVTNGKETCVAVYSVVYDEFGVMCGRGQEKRFGVTHWMPMPEPPKESAEG